MAAAEFTVNLLHLAEVRRIVEAAAAVVIAREYLPAGSDCCEAEIDALEQALAALDALVERK